MNKQLILLAGWMMLANFGFCQHTKLIVRSDDMGMSHAANLACIRAFREGIATSVEVMVPTPWFLEAVSMLRDVPEYDVGIHLVITSEWANLKWRPLTHAPSLTDSNGYFFPTIWKGTPDFPSLLEQQPDFGEAERELRAQIEMAKKHLPRLSHLSTHMGLDHAHPQLEAIVKTLSLEYGLPILLAGKDFLDFPSNEELRSDKPSLRIRGFVRALNTLDADKTYLMVTHPANDSPEMSGIHTSSYANVRADRAADLALLTSAKVRKALRRKGVLLSQVSSKASSIN